MAINSTTKPFARIFLLMLCAVTLSFMAATQMLAHIFLYQPALGDSLIIGSVRLYWPWTWLDWDRAWGSQYPRPFALARFIALAGVGLALIAPITLRPRKHGMRPFGEGAWADFSDVAAAGLFAESGAILGKFDGETLAFDGPEHQILIGASRSGKGRGHVVPSLLTWSASALVLVVKGELDSGDARHGFPGTSGFRGELGPVLRFAPTDLRSQSFNPLFEVRRGANEIRDIQNIVEALVQPHGESRGTELFWNNKGKDIITGVVVHVLYSETVERKTLAVVREKLRDLDRTAEEMRLTLHRLNPKTNQAEVHPEVLHAAQSYLSGEERLRSSVQATAESFFGMFADPIVAEKTSASDFRIGDLMCGERPVTLYLQPPPSDAPRLMPLMRLFINLTARSLMEDQTHDAEGREKKHRLLMLLDEFPQLGRLDFFEKMMGAMAGYGVKVYLVCQSLNHIIKVYGRDNVILDNAHIITSFSAADPETAKRISDMAGEVWEIRPHESEQRPRAVFGPHKGTITYREERRPLLLPADVRALPRNEQLIFVAGAKPIRAKKLRFDHEPIFAKRLRPPAPRADLSNVEHDWIHVSALGRIAPELKPRPSLKANRYAEQGQPQTAAAQSDLFTASPPPAPPNAEAPKISEIALAGLRGPHPSMVSAPAEATKRARTTGV
jgi:type IV secretion system protein VirD4